MAYAAHKKKNIWVVPTNFSSFWHSGYTQFSFYQQKLPSRTLSEIMHCFFSCVKTVLLTCQTVSTVLWSHCAIIITLCLKTSPAIQNVTKIVIFKYTLQNLQHVSSIFNPKLNHYYGQKTI